MNSTPVTPMLYNESYVSRPARSKFYLYGYRSSSFRYSSKISSYIIDVGMKSKFAIKNRNPKNIYALAGIARLKNASC